MKTLVAVPCMDMVHTDFMESMINLHKPDNAFFTVVKNTLIYDAREVIAQNAVKYGFDRVAWFDSDMRIPADALVTMMRDMDKGRQVVSGLYFTRREKIKPVCYKRLWWRESDSGEIDTGAENYFGYPDGVFPCEGVGFGCCLTSVQILREVGERFGTVFTPLPALGEDLSFCWRVRQLGEGIFCDSRIKCGHIGFKEYGEGDCNGLDNEQPAGIM